MRCCGITYALCLMPSYPPLLLHLHTNQTPSLHTVETLRRQRACLSFICIFLRKKNPIVAKKTVCEASTHPGQQRYYSLPKKYTNGCAFTAESSHCFSSAQFVMQKMHINLFDTVSLKWITTENTPNRFFFPKTCMFFCRNSYTHCGDFPAYCAFASKSNSPLTMHTGLFAIDDHEVTSSPHMACVTTGKIQVLAFWKEIIVHAELNASIHWM